MPPGKVSMIKKMSALVREPSVNSNNQHNPQPSKPENLLQQQQREQQQQQRAPSRQAIADAAKASFVKGSNRFAPPHPPPVSSIPAPPRRANTHPEGSQERRNGGALWEESTVGSLLDESQGSDGRGGETNNNNNNNNNNSNPVVRNSYHNHPPHHPPPPPPPPAPPSSLPKPEDRLFTINPDGRFTLADEQQRTNLASGVQNSLGRTSYGSPRAAHTSIRHSHHLSDTTDLKQPQPRSLTRARLPLRERETKRPVYNERTTLPGFPPGYDAMGISTSKPTIQSATIPYDDAATKALEQKRSTVFQLSSDDGMGETDDGEVEDDEQRTPRANRYRPQSPIEAIKQSPPKYRPSYGLQESVLPHNVFSLTSNREKERVKKRKNMDLDYDEHTLKTMHFESLKDEPFDYDPGVGQSPIRSNRSKIEIGDRLKHYKNKESQSQGEFFKKLTVDEWEEAGDWFLDQFGSLIGQLKSARQVKRKICRDFEDEIERRHVAVQNKMELIDDTLEKMKSEGEIMMKDKEIG